MKKIEIIHLAGVATVALGLALSTLTPAAAADDPRLGRVWKEIESNVWEGTWTRRGTSNVFDAEWRRTGTNDIRTGVLTMEFTGRPGTVDQDTILIFRQDDRGGRCNYIGHFSSPANHNSAGGTYSCVGGGTAKWAASIVAR